MFFGKGFMSGYEFPEDERIKKYYLFRSNFLKSNALILDGDFVIKERKFFFNKKVFWFQNNLQIKQFSDDVQIFWKNREKNAIGSLVDMIAKNRIEEKINSGEFKITVEITSPKIKVLDEEFREVAELFCSKFNKTFEGINAEIVN